MMSVEPARSDLPSTRMYVPASPTAECSCLIAAFGAADVRGTTAT